jgi:glyoxylase-like metal-dependent hydrolase (beta-lactamase superfamily II)
MSSLIRLVPVTEHVYVATSRRYVTNSTVILDGHGGALVIDPSWDADELAAIPADLRALGVTCVAGLATHMHYDHVLWHPDLGEVPRWASAGTVEAIVNRRAELLEPLIGDIPEDLINLAGHLVPIDGPTLDWRGPTAVIHQHDAHAAHHISVEIPDLGVLVSGDMLSDLELPMPDWTDVNLETYRAGLLLLSDAARRAERVIPGHGSVGVDVRERYEADLAYLNDVDQTGASADPRINLELNNELHELNVRRSLFAATV